MSALTAHLAYYGKGALHTFWQAAAAALITAFTGDGLNVAHLAQVPALEKIGGAAALAGVAAVFAYVKALLRLPAPGDAPAIDPGLPDPPA